MSSVQFPDESDFEFEERRKFEEYYGEYSDSVRKRLRAFNVPKPENIYDVYDVLRKLNYQVEVKNTDYIGEIPTFLEDFKELE